MISAEICLNGVIGSFNEGLKSMKEFIKINDFRKHIEVHGRPMAAVFRSKPNTHQDEVIEKKFIEFKIIQIFLFRPGLWTATLQ